jgi:monofunctional chorismate mutase
MVKAVRGAITVRENSAEAIREASRRLLLELLQCNRVVMRRILSLVFSVTRDLTRLNPAGVARELGLTDTPLFCVQEADIEGALPRVIRVLITYSAPRGRAPVPVYLEGARGLRPDLAEGAES